MYAAMTGRRRGDTFDRRRGCSCCSWRLGTATVSDALDSLRLPGSAAGLLPLAPGQRMAGPAFTVRYVPGG